MVGRKSPSRKQLKKSSRARIIETRRSSSGRKHCNTFCSLARSRNIRFAQRERVLLKVTGEPKAAPCDYKQKILCGFTTADWRRIKISARRRHRCRRRIGRARNICAQHERSICAAPKVRASQQTRI